MKELTAGNTKSMMKSVGASSADLWKVAPDKLRVLEGFNVRVRDDAYAKRVRWIADSIKANGFYLDKPLSGFVADNVIYIIGGHRRYEAAMLAIAEGAEIPALPVVIKPRGTSMEDLNVDLIVGNDGDPLTTYEQALVCKRLVGFGWETKEIARRLGYSSTQYVDGLLTLTSAPQAVRKMVEAGTASATVAIEAIKTQGGKAAQVLAEAAAKSKTGRATAKHMPGAAKVSKKELIKVLLRVKAETAYSLLSDDVRAEIEMLFPVN